MDSIIILGTEMRGDYFLVLVSLVLGVFTVLLRMLVRAKGEFTIEEEMSELRALLSQSEVIELILAEKPQSRNWWHLQERRELSQVIP
jgi:hypothetical protein